jgi:endonuclease/exonuclease/phosphatase family metal-dependent hydrolase
MTWNLERGMGLDEQVAAFERGVLPVPDVLLVSEADRGCSRSGGRNVVRDLAEVLALNAVFGVEFVELPRPWGAGGRITRACEHGNAILSRFPLEEPRLLRFAATRSWYIGPGARDRGGEPRLGGRMALSADVVLGERRLRAYTLHLESGPADGDVRARQASELLTDVGSEGVVVVGGDTNFHLYGADLLLGSALESGAFRLRAFGFRDAHEALPVTARGTHLRWLVIDLLLGRGLHFESPGLCPAARCGELSDHLPVWARATFEG